MSKETKAVVTEATPIMKATPIGGFTSNRGSWKSGLFGCCKYGCCHPALCCTIFAPTILMGQVRYQKEEDRAIRNICWIVDSLNCHCLCDQLLTCSIPSPVCITNEYILQFHVVHTHFLYNSCSLA